MPRALILYFSQGKTTKKIASVISKGLESEGLSVDLYDITQDTPPEMTDYDVVGIGSPVYVFRPPFNVMEFLKSLPNLNGLPFFCFILHGTLSGATGNILREHLTLKGGKEIGYAKYKGACDSCSVCLHKCPNNNIFLNENGQPRWGRDCLFCLYCQMKCPKDAIKSVVDWPIMAPFMNYNVSQAINQI